MDTQDRTALLALAHDAYSRYYKPWLVGTVECSVERLAVYMGVEGCRATFRERKDVAREVLERMSHEERTV